MAALTRGLLVRIRPHLPELRVLDVSSGSSEVPTVAVSWYTEDGKPRRANLPADALEPIPTTAESLSPGSG